jgi:hypothetical protein
MYDKSGIDAVDRYIRWIDRCDLGLIELPQNILGRCYLVEIPVLESLC